MVSNNRLKRDIIAFFTQYQGRYPCYINKVHIIAKRDTVQLFNNIFHINK